MGKIVSLQDATNLIWETVEIEQEMEEECPYLFIVGGGNFNTGNFDCEWYY